MASPPRARSPWRSIGPRPGAGAAIAAVAAAVLLIEHGWPLGAAARAFAATLNAGLAAALAVTLALDLARADAPRRHLRTRALDWLLLAALVLALVATRLPPLDRHGATAIVVEAYLAANVALRLLRAQELVLALRIRPVALLAGSFAALVLAGTVLLSLPRAGNPAAPALGWVDALFTATSAACVTGLTVRDVGRELSPFGQGVVLALIQLGGLGIITFVATLGVLTGRVFSVPQLVVLREIVSSQGLADVRRQVLTIAAVALGIELAGAAVLYAAWPEQDAPVAGRAFQSLFHAVSAFCNAGFTLTRDSLVGVGARPVVVGTMAALIVIGGLGSPVLRDLVYRRPRHARRLLVHTRLALLATGVLLVVGAVGVALLEAGGALAGRAPAAGGLVALFTSVTARTAGFTTVPIDDLRPATLVLLIVLMTIGAGPVSTGGGIKTVTFAVLLLTVRAMLVGRDRVEVFGRTLPRGLVYAALSVFLLYVLAAVVVTFALAACEPAVPLHRLTFEAVSALGTVGLSTGITAELGTPARLVLCVAMFAGRVGPLALAMTVFGSRAAANYEYPQEEVVIG